MIFSKTNFTVFSVFVPPINDAGISYASILAVSIVTNLLAHVMLPILADHVSLLGVLLLGISEAGASVSLRMIMYKILLATSNDPTVTSNTSLFLGNASCSISMLLGNQIAILYFSIGFRKICYYICAPIISVCFVLSFVQIIVHKYGLCERTYAIVRET